MKTSFANADQAAVPTEPVDQVPANAVSANSNTTTAVAEVPRTEIVPDTFFQNEGVEGDFDSSDLKMPKFALAQNVGSLSQELGFSPGTFVYNRETVLGRIVRNPEVTPAGTPGPIIGTDGIVLTLIRLRKYLVEDLPYGSEVFPAIFNGEHAAEEARRAGFLPHTDKKAMGPDHRYFKPVIDADVLIKGDATNITFPFDYEGTPYAIARWTLQSTAYNRVGKQMYSDSRLALRSGLATKFYTVSARKEKLGQNSVFVPKAAITGLNPAAFQKWIKDVTA